jgi:WD40 repeat protein
VDYLDVRILGCFNLDLVINFIFLIFFFQVAIGAYDSPQIDLYDSLLSNEKIKSFKTSHLYGIKCLKYLSMSGYVASCSETEIGIWNPNTGELIRKYTKHTDTVNGLDQINVDKMVSGSGYKIHIWEISTGLTLNIIDVYSWVNSAKFLSNGLIAYGLHGAISIYEYSTGNLTNTLVGHSGDIVSIEILNNQFMASGSEDRKVIIWDLYSYSIKYTLSQHEIGVLCIKRLSPSLMASGDQSGLIIIWNWLNGSLVHKLNAHIGFVYFLDLYDDKTLISGSQDKKLKLTLHILFKSGIFKNKLFLVHPI